MNLVDPVTNQIKPGTFLNHSSGTTQLTPTSFRLGMAQGFGGAAVGDLFSMRGVTKFATLVSASAAVTFSHYTVYSGGFGFLENGGAGGHVYQNVAVTFGLAPAGATRRRLVSTLADK